MQRSSIGRFICGLAGDPLGRSAPTGRHSCIDTQQIADEPIEMIPDLQKSGIIVARRAEPRAAVARGRGTEERERPLVGAAKVWDR